MIKSSNTTELKNLYHEIKRNQIFNINNPSEFKSKIDFLQKFNIRLKEVDTFFEFKMYFEYIENIYLTMNEFYVKFNDFYTSLEKQDKVELFVNYLFAYFNHLTQELLLIIDNYRENENLNKLLDTTSSYSIPNKDNNSIDIDQQIEFIAEFMQTNISFFKYKSKIDEILIKPYFHNDESIEKEFINFFQDDNFSILNSFSIWKNAIECIDLINLFDWNISKLQDSNNTEYLIKPKKEQMNIFINKEFGYFLYLNLKHMRMSMQYTKEIIPLVEKKDMIGIVQLEYEYIKNIFENEYFIESKIFNQKINNFCLEAYIKFYLIYRTYFFYFYNNEKNETAFIVNWEFFLKLFIASFKVFENIVNMKNEEEVKSFFEKSLDFYTNNGDDFFNYPFFKYDFMTYAVPITIKYANTPRLFVERFDDIISKFSEKGKTLEEKLLPSEKTLSFRNIEMRKNIKLKNGSITIGEIDLLLFDGHNLIISELKNQKIYYGYKPMYQRKKDLKKASIQLNRIENYIIKNKTKLSKKLNINLHAVKKIIPIIITPLDELNNQKIDNCLVVNSLLVKSYFEYDHFAIREFGMDTNNVVKRMYFNEKYINLDDFIAFIRSNKSIKLLKFFKDKKIGNSVVFQKGNIKFSRTLMKVR
ncbi:hypothetical protein [Sulfurimonas sp.]|uniref:hypothetical protein n=1 Tax=Sulfurimonas sp. TaxID=2022749 RepID=UPI003D0A853A